MPSVRTDRHAVKLTVCSSRLLKFGQGNAKLPAYITTFSLPAGHACPFAHNCRSSADRENGFITDGPHTEFRCYKASEEARYKTSRENGWWNYDLLRACETHIQMVELILDSLLPGTPCLRIHTGGDFFSRDYFLAWLDVAKKRRKTIFYFYTKSIRYWVGRLADVGTGYEPGQVSNFVPTASWGGRDDHLITQYGLRSARVVHSEQEATHLGLELDHDDSNAVKHGPDFGLLIHGTQPSGSDAARAVAALRAQGEYGYGDRADAVRQGRRFNIS